MLLGKNFDEIDQATIDGLVGAGATESVHLDFKRDMYGRTDDDKKEFLKDVSAFANSLGGHLLIGMAEEEGAASQVMPLAGINIDEELLRLENIARTGIEPAVIGLRLRRVAVNGGEIVLIHIPPSYNPPHRVIFKGGNRYHARNSSGTYELSLEELRMLFGKQRTIEERARSFVRERFLRIRANDGSLILQMQEGGMVMHLVPLPDFASERHHEIAALKLQYPHFEPMGTQGHSWSINIDGFVTYRSGPICRGYTQVFRNGTFEATNASVFNRHEGRRLFGSLSLASMIIGSISSYMTVMKTIDASPPIMLQISFFGMNGVNIGLNNFYTYENPTAYTREELHLPSSVISNYLADNNYSKIVSEQMDFLWNVFGLDRCPYFDHNGNWIGQQQ
jgi:hypothetical protein